VNRHGEILRGIMWNIETPLWPVVFSRVVGVRDEFIRSVRNSDYFFEKSESVYSTTRSNYRWFRRRVLDDEIPARRSSNAV